MPSLAPRTGNGAASERPAVTLIRSLPRRASVRLCPASRLDGHSRVTVSLWNADWRARTRAVSKTGAIAVAIGAVLGAWSRWGLSYLFNVLWPSLPPGTLTANLVGAYVIGFFIELFSLH